ncbi:MAG TPA: type II secretion system protein [Polyangium sp.]|jgi:general secretion pathway protein G|nr:type II secretion system protein [Polyangium sp.]
MKVKANQIRKWKRAASRGVTLVEVLIVLAIMAIIAGGATALVFPRYKESQIRGAVLSAGVIKTAAQQYMHLDSIGGGCPTIKELVDGKHIDATKTEDPWGTPFKIQCDGDEITVISAGRDRKENTPDDVKDVFKDADIKRIAAL